MFWRKAGVCSAVSGTSWHSAVRCNPLQSGWMLCPSQIRKLWRRSDVFNPRYCWSQHDFYTDQPRALLPLFSFHKEILSSSETLWEPPLMIFTRNSPVTSSINCSLVWANVDWERTHRRGIWQDGFSRDQYLRHKMAHWRVISSRCVTYFSPHWRAALGGQRHYSFQWEKWKWAQILEDLFMS